MRPVWWEEACIVLARDDSVMAALIERYPGVNLVTRGTPFRTLLRAIVGQQISTKAADAVWMRFETLGNVDVPEVVLTLADESVRAAGLSARKAAYIKNLAQYFADNRIDVADFAKQSDQAIINVLTAVPGIGRWTAEMFLIFNLIRPDVWPISDIGVQKAVAFYYLNGVRPNITELQGLGERWSPWRTVASWYLWRSLDQNEVRY